MLYFLNFIESELQSIVRHHYLMYLLWKKSLSINLLHIFNNFLEFYGPLSVRAF